jgi:outer membrane protein OmpA-like peptidoglycan-associated protein
MTGDDSCAQRFAKIWLGPSLVMLLGIGSTVEPAAMPIPAAQVEVPGPTLIQQSPGPPEEAQQPAGTPPAGSADESEPDSFIELHKALDAARERLGHLSRAAEAVAAAGQLQQEVAALRKENQQLHAEIDAVRAERGDLETARQAAEARAAERNKTLEEITAKAWEMEQELVAVRSQSEQGIAAADAARVEAEARLNEMRDSLQRAEQEKARTGADLAKVQGELASTKEQVAATQQEQAQLQQRVVALRDERDESEQRIAAADAPRVEAEARLSETRDSLQRAEQEGARAAELTKALEEAGAKAREMEQELAAVRAESEQRIAAADAPRSEAEAQLSEMRARMLSHQRLGRHLTDRLQRAQQEKARVDADLARIQGELATAKEQVAAARQERAQIEQWASALQYERDDLRTRMADATARLRPTEAAKAQLEREVANLREAARTAANDTRQLIEALSAIGLAAGPLEADAALLAESGMPSAGEQADAEERDAAAPVGNVAPVVTPSHGPKPASADADVERTRTASAMRPDDGEVAHLDQRAILGGRPAVFPMLADLPPEKRQHVQDLLAELPSKLEERGLMTTVPGELLFTVGSDEVQTGAYTTLAKVAELIDMYDNRQVRIIGHSDAMGDPADNRQLSERRAERVKEILVNYYEIAADQLSTEGLGDTQPIASNATPEGQRANRRVEVLILN